MVIIKPKTKKYRVDLINECLVITKESIEEYKGHEGDPAWDDWIKKIYDDEILLKSVLNDESVLFRRKWHKTSLINVHCSKVYYKLNDNWKLVPETI